MIGCQRSAATRQIKKLADGEDELQAVELDHKLSERQKFSLYKDLESYRSPWDTSYVSSKNKQQKEKVAKRERRRKEECRRHLWVSRRVSPPRLTNHSRRIRQICNCIFCCETSWSGTWQYAQRKVSTCNVPMLRDKLKENVARITGHLPTILILILRLILILILPTLLIFTPVLTNESSTAAAAKRFSDPPASFSCRLCLSFCRPLSVSGNVEGHSSREWSAGKKSGMSVFH